MIPFRRTKACDSPDPFLASQSSSTFAQLYSALFDVNMIARVRRFCQNMQNMLNTSSGTAASPCMIGTGPTGRVGLGVCARGASVFLVDCTETGVTFPAAIQEVRTQARAKTREIKMTTEENS